MFIKNCLEAAAGVGVAEGPEKPRISEANLSDANVKLFNKAVARPQEGWAWGDYYEFTGPRVAYERTFHGSEPHQVVMVVRYSDRQVIVRSVT